MLVITYQTIFVSLLCFLSIRLPLSKPAEGFGCDWVQGFLFHASINIFCDAVDLALASSLMSYDEFLFVVCGFAGVRLAGMTTQALSSAERLIAVVALEPVVLLDLLSRVCWPNDDLAPDLEKHESCAMTYITNTRLALSGLNRARVAQRRGLLNHCTLTC